MDVCGKCGGVVDRLKQFVVKLTDKNSTYEITGHKTCTDEIYFAIKGIQKLEKLTIPQVLDILRKEGVLFEEEKEMEA